MRSNIIANNFIIKKITKPYFGRETLNVQLQQTKALVRRRTEVLVHGSTVDGEKEEEKFKPRSEKTLKEF